MATIAMGIQIGFASGFLAEIIDVNPPNPTRDSIDISHQQTENARRFTPSKLADWGALEVTLAFNPATAPPINAAPESITLTFPDAAVWSFNGFLTEYRPEGRLDDKMTANVTIKVDGAVTVV